MPGMFFDEGGGKRRLLAEQRMQLLRIGADPQKLHSLLRKQTPLPATLIEKHSRHQAQQANRSSDLILDLMEVPVPMSEDYLIKIVEELVQNAFKFSTVGAPVHVALNHQPDSAVLTVSDRGRGLSPEHVAKIGAYMQFDRKMHEQQGLGLGLTICKRLTELHGGTLTIQSEPGTGTTVTVRLPKVGGA